MLYYLLCLLFENKDAVLCVTFVSGVKVFPFDKSVREIGIRSGGKTVESLTGCIRDLSGLGASHRLSISVT